VRKQQEEKLAHEVELAELKARDAELLAARFQKDLAEALEKQR
jgi:hypothetical protein